MDWKRLHNVIARAKARKQLTRSSNFYSVTLKDVVLQSGHNKMEMPTDPVARDVLACRLVGFESLPLAVCDLYDATPSRDFWKAMLQEWLLQVKGKCLGALDHYYMKCCLDRLFAVRQIDHGTISWWPTKCPSYTKWYEALYAIEKSFNEEEKFQILCATYRKLNAARSCTFPEALAQTCWHYKEENGRLIMS